MRNNKKIIAILSLIVIVALVGISWLVVKNYWENKQAVELTNQKLLEDIKEHIQIGDNCKAEEEINNILNNNKLFKSLSKNEKFTIYNYLGIIDLQQSKSLNAIIHYEEANKFADKNNKLKSYINMAIAYRNAGEYIKSSEILVKVSRAKIRNKEENATLKSYALLNLAEVYVNVGNYNEFDLVLNKIDSLLGDVPPRYKEDLEIMYNTYLVIYNIHGNNINEAKNELDKINELKKDNKDTDFTELDILELRAKALYYKKTGNTKEALKNFEELGNVSKSNGNYNLELFSLSQRIKLYKDIGDESNYNKLLEQYFYKEQEFKKNNNSQYRSHLDNEFIKDINDDYSRALHIIIIIFVIFMIILILSIKRIRKYEKKSIKDSLCDIYNRRFLDEYIFKIKKKNFPVSIMMIDVDYFKLYNDNYGHQAGDLVLKSIAGVLKNSCKKNDIVIRYGGEEFCILLGNTLKNESIEIAKQININMLKEKIPHKYSVVSEYITLSIGISTVYSTNHIDRGIRFSDKALYITKQSGRNGYNHIEDVIEKEIFK